MLIGRVRVYAMSHDTSFPLWVGERRKEGATFHGSPQPPNMDKFGPSGDSASSGAPGNGRFAAQAATAEDLLKAQTVGLVNLNDYRKRRAEAIELKERGSSAASSGADTPVEGYRSLASAICCVEANLPSTEYRH